MCIVFPFRGRTEDLTDYSLAILVPYLIWKGWKFVLLLEELKGCYLNQAIHLYPLKKIVQVPNMRKERKVPLIKLKQLASPRKSWSVWSITQWSAYTALIRKHKLSIKISCSENLKLAILFNMVKNKFQVTPLTEPIRFLSSVYSPLTNKHVASNNLTSIT